MANTGISPKNPILKGFNPDPSILCVGDDYYIATSTFEWYPGVQLFHSKDLENWEFIGRPLAEGRLLDMTGVADSCGVWAPCLSYSDGLFWLCYTNTKRFDGEFKDTPNYVITASDISGPWSDPIYLNSSGFDPSLFHDDDGRKWISNMVWDHRPNRSYFRGIVLQEFDVENKHLTGPKKVIFDGTEADCTEGPHIYKRLGFYYLMTAEGGTGYEHCVTMARSKSIWGPYETDPAGPVITAHGTPLSGIQRTGHASVVETPDGETYMAHLCSRPIDGKPFSPMGRESALQKMYWTEDGWLRLADWSAAFKISETEQLADCRYDFSGDSLPEDFQWLRTPKSDLLFSMTAAPNALRLYGRESLGSLFLSSLVARRQTHARYKAVTKLDFSPNNFQQAAGLVIYYNGHKFHYLNITFDDDKGRVLSIMSACGTVDLKATYPLDGEDISIPDEGPVWLKARVHDLALTFYYSVDGESWHQVGPDLDYSLITDEAGKGEGANFTGAFVGMTCQDLTGEALHADFHAFAYCEKD